MRSLLLASLAVFLGSCASLGRERAADASSLAGAWRVQGEDADRWTAELLLVEGSHEGCFDWKSENGASGHELVTWMYYPGTRMILLTGLEMQNPVGNCGVGTYVARVADDGRSMVNGTWGPPALPGTWVAKR
jgi:hypothetical protein